MGKPRRIDYHPADMIAGVAGQLSAQDFGVYWMVCTLIYDRGGPIDDDHLWLARLFSETHWRSIRASVDRLVVMDKIQLIEPASESQGGRKLMVKRCAEALQAARKRIAQASLNGVRGGRPPNENKDIAEPGGLSPEKLARGATFNLQPPTSKVKDAIASQKKPRKHRLPDGWRPKEGGMRAASDVGYNAETTERILENFENWALGAGKVMSDWNRCWINFVRSDITRRQFGDTAKVGGDRQQTGSWAATADRFLARLNGGDDGVEHGLRDVAEHQMGAAQEPLAGEPCGSVNGGKNPDRSLSASDATEHGARADAGKGTDEKPG